MTFTSDEMNLICIYNTSDKAELENSSVCLFRILKMRS